MKYVSVRWLCVYSYCQPDPVQHPSSATLVMSQVGICRNNNLQLPQIYRFSHQDNDPAHALLVTNLEYNSM